MVTPPAAQVINVPVSQTVVAPIAMALSLSGAGVYAPSAASWLSARLGTACSQCKPGPVLQPDLKRACAIRTSSSQRLHTMFRLLLQLSRIRACGCAGMHSCMSRYAGPDALSCAGRVPMQGQTLLDVLLAMSVTLSITSGGKVDPGSIKVRGIYYQVQLAVSGRRLLVRHTRLICVSQRASCGKPEAIEHC